MMNTLEKLKKEITDNTIILYMKGSPDRPQCGFSAKVVQVLNACAARFSSVDVLADPEVRATLPQVANWPTFPQLYIKGELVGGCDIILEMYQSGELKTLIDEAS
jgi:monothiol glutaredoxin